MNKSPHIYPETDTEFEDINSNLPLISIGVPVRNSERTIRQSLNSLVNQTYPNLEIIVSDNASTDNTLMIVREFSSRCDSIRIFMQPLDIGPTANFAFVLEESKGEYFAWNAGDDLKSKDFIMSNYINLKQNKNSIASISTTIFEGDAYSNKSRGPNPLLGSPMQRIQSFFSQADASHGLFYSLFRTQQLKQCTFIPEIFLGWDWGIVLFMASLGDFSKTETEYTILGRKGISLSGRKDVYRLYGVTGLKNFFPFFVLTKYVIEISKHYQFNDRLKIIQLLAKLNFKTVILNSRIGTKMHLILKSDN
jgi:glycosyltransferase involved in cell wall biosynthesis